MITQRQWQVALESLTAEIIAPEPKLFQSAKISQLSRNRSCASAAH